MKHNNTKVFSKERHIVGFKEGIKVPSTINKNTKGASPSYLIILFSIALGAGILYLIRL